MGMPAAGPSKPWPSTSATTARPSRSSSEDCERPPTGTPTAIKHKKGGRAPPAGMAGDPSHFRAEIPVAFG